MMKAIFYFIALTLTPAAMAEPAPAGFVGLTLSARDYGLVTDIAPDTPAANSPIQVGDRIVAFGRIPISQIHSVEDLRKAASGVPGSEITLVVRPAHTQGTIRVHLRRVAPRKIPADFNRYQASNDIYDLVSRCSRENIRA